MERLKKILIVDDEPTILLSLPYCLEGEGVEVLTSIRLDEAKQAVRREFFDLVITDIRMSGVYGAEGIELLNYIKKVSPDTKVIVMTAYSLNGEREFAMSQGAYMFYDKPIDIDDLLERIHEMGIPAGSSSNHPMMNNLRRYRLL